MHPRFLLTALVAAGTAAHAQAPAIESPVQLDAFVTTGTRFDAHVGTTNGTFLFAKVGWKF